MVRSGRVGPEFHYTDPTRPDQTRPTDRLGLRQVSGLCLVVDLSAQSRHVRTLSAVEFRNDTTRPDQRQSLARPVPNSTTKTRTGPDPTRQSPRTCRRPVQTQLTLSETSETRVSDKVLSGPPSGSWTLFVYETKLLSVF